MHCDLINVASLAEWFIRRGKNLVKLSTNWSAYFKGDLELDLEVKHELRTTRLNSFFFLHSQKNKTFCVLECRINAPTFLEVIFKIKKQELFLTIRVCVCVFNPAFVPLLFHLPSALKKETLQREGDVSPFCTIII